MRIHLDKTIPYKVLDRSKREPKDVIFEYCKHMVTEMYEYATMAHRQLVPSSGSLNVWHDPHQKALRVVLGVDTISEGKDETLDPETLADAIHTEWKKLR